MIDLVGKVLVVVDMERGSGYRRSMTEHQVRTVEALINEAVRVDSFVIFLEFLDEGTLRRLLRCVRGYDMFVQKEKEAPDGSDEVLELCKSGEYDASAFVICGISTHCCVAETAENLAASLPNSIVEVVMEGCGDEEGNRWDEFPQANNLRLVSVVIDEEVEDEEAA